MRYQPSKKVWAAGVAAALILGGFSVPAASVHAERKNYDAAAAGISSRVDAYVENGEASDLVIAPSALDITASLARTTVSADFTAASPEDAAVETASEGDASATDAASSTDASTVSASRYPQFQDRAVAITSGALNIRSEASTDSEIVGTLPRGGVCLVKEKGDTWSYIASGSCYGYVLNSYLAFGDAAGDFEEANGTQKVAKVNTATLMVRAKADENSDIVTLIPEGESYTVLSRGDNWTEILIDDTTQGFVKNEYVDLQYETARAVSVAEQQALEAKEKAEAEAAAAAAAGTSADTSTSGTNQQTSGQQNSSQQTSGQQSSSQQQTSQQQSGTSGSQQNGNASSQSQQQTAPVTPATTQAPATEAPTTQAPAVPASATGASAASYACQFVGNPYVWGGTSLTNGADCSGFVMSVYAQFGRSLPHNAAAQSGCGTEVSLSALQPGDLLFYSNGGGISHVAIYIGGGSIVHAASSRDGIKISAYNYKTPVKAVRIL